MKINFNPLKPNFFKELTSKVAITQID